METPGNREWGDTGVEEGEGGFDDLGGREGV